MTVQASAPSLLHATRQYRGSSAVRSAKHEPFSVEIAQLAFDRLELSTAEDFLPRRPSLLDLDSLVLAHTPELDVWPRRLAGDWQRTHERQLNWMHPRKMTI